MSLINEALKRARGEAERQAEAERTGGAPPPGWTPPPFSRRERSPVVASVLASLAASTAVGLGFYLFLHRDAPQPQPQIDRVTSAAAPVAAAPLPAVAVQEPVPPPPAPEAAPQRSLRPAPASERPKPGAGESPDRRSSRTREAPGPGVTRDGSATPAAAPDAGARATVPARAESSVAVPPSPRRGGDERTLTGGTTLPSGEKLTLDGIISGAIPLAMLNGRMIGIGEFAGDCALLKIEARRVQLRCPSGTLWLGLP